MGKKQSSHGESGSLQGEEGTLQVFSAKKYESELIIFLRLKQSFLFPILNLL